MRAQIQGFYATRQVGRKKATRGFTLNAGVFGIPLATVAALAILPTDTTAQGALFWSSWILTLGLLSGVVVDVLANGLRSLFKAQHILMLAVPIIVYAEPLQLYYSANLDYESVRNAFLSI